MVFYSGSRQGGGQGGTGYYGGYAGGSASSSPGTTSLTPQQSRDWVASRRVKKSGKATKTGATPGWIPTGPGPWASGYVPYGTSVGSLYNPGGPWNVVEKDAAYPGGLPSNFGYNAGRTTTLPGNPYRSRTEDRWVAPLYKEGMEFYYPVENKLSETQIGEWQKFFMQNGWRVTPYAGTWGQAEAYAMRQFMSLANATPAGTTVEALRSSIQAQLGKTLPYGVLAKQMKGGEASATEINAMLEAMGINTGDGGSSSGARDTTPQVTTSISKNTQIALTGRNDAMMLLRNSLTNQLGRAPTDAEVKIFLRELNAAERADPSISTSKQISTYYPATGKTVSKSSSTSHQSEVNPQAEAEQAARANTPERRAYQSLQYVQSIFDELGL